jgi:hypothetical protein
LKSKVDKMAGWWNGELMKWKIVEMESWWNSKLVKWKVDVSPKLMKWQVDEMTNWWNATLMKCWVDQTTQHRIIIPSKEEQQLVKQREKIRKIFKQNIFLAAPRFIYAPRVSIH